MLSSDANDLFRIFPIDCVERGHLLNILPSNVVVPCGRNGRISPTVNTSVFQAALLIWLPLLHIAREESRKTKNPLHYYIAFYSCFSDLISEDMNLHVDYF